MRRRTFVTTAGLVGVAALAGCVTDSDGDDSDNGGAADTPDDRVDAPPHDPERPPETDEEWDPHWLGAGMATEPSLSFETVEATLTDQRLDTGPSDTDPEFAATLVTAEEELASRVDLAASGDRLETVDFDAETVVVVESGYGSSSIHHAWQRVVEVEDGIYLHGYHVKPLAQTDDIVARHSVAVVETPLDRDDRAHVSLTYSGDWRANFDSTEGVVGVGGDDPDGGTGPDY